MNCSVFSSLQRFAICLSIFLITIFAQIPSYAVGSSGFENASLSTRSLSRGNAVTANPEDASTVAFNPAGLPFVEEEVYFGGNLVLTNYLYEGREDLGKSTERASRSVIPIPYAYAAIDTPVENLKLGIGVNSPFGLITKYSSVGNFSRVAYYNELLTQSHHISLGYRINDQWSIGGGWTQTEMEIKQVGKFNQNLVAGTSIDPTYEYDVEGQGQGWNLGVYLELDERNHIGAFYRSEQRIHLKGLMNTHELTGGYAVVFGTGTSNITSVDTDYSLPASITLGWNHKFNEKFDFAIDVVYTGWDSLDDATTTFGTSNAILDGFQNVTRDYKDVFSVHTGGSYDYNDDWTINGGYYWQDMAANPLNYTNEIPDGDRHGFVAGFERKLSENMTLDFYYLFILSAKVDINNIAGISNSTEVSGEYSGNLQLWSLGLRRLF